MSLRIEPSSDHLFGFYCQLPNNIMNFIYLLRYNGTIT